MHPVRLKFQKGDILAIILVALLAAGVFLSFLPGVQRLPPRRRCT